MKGLNGQVVDRNEESVGEEEEAKHTEDEFWLVEWPDQLGAGDLLRVGRVDRSDCEVGDDEESEDHKGTDSHGPAESNLLDETGDHDGEDDTTDTRAGCKDAKGSSSIAVKPSVNRR